MAMRNTTRWCPYKRRVCDSAARGCPDCPQDRIVERPSRVRRGYTQEWQRIREEVLLRSGIPRQDWPLYDVDHDPPYDAAVEADHRRYTLTPMLRADHSRKTATRDARRHRDGKFVKKW